MVAGGGIGRGGGIRGVLRGCGGSSGGTGGPQGVRGVLRGRGGS